MVPNSLNWINIKFRDLYVYKKYTIVGIPKSYRSQSNLRLSQNLVHVLLIFEAFLNVLALENTVHGAPHVWTLFVARDFQQEATTFPDVCEFIWKII